MENYLKQNVAQLFSEKLCILKVNGLDDFAGLLKKVVPDRGLNLAHLFKEFILNGYYLFVLPLVHF